MSILLPENAITIVRGSSKTLNLTVKDKNGDPVNLTGSTIYLTVKKNVKDRDPLIQKVSTDIAQIEIANPTDGTAQIFLIPDDTASRPITSYVFDVWVILSSGERFVVVPPSVFQVVAGVTYLVP